MLARRARGQVCGDPALQGDRIAPIVGRVSGCGVAEPVRLRAVSGLRLSTPARMDCRTARALKTWVEEGVKPATGTLGGGPSSLRVAAGYACRTRNNQPGARISEHGKGRAIDISGIGLRSGQEITVLTDWGRGEAGRVLREVWRAACGPFGTVLGPEANRFHRDHFHFDTARYRSGSFCR
ncbi:MAG: extensin family protein [Pseudomonadota bacterium]